MSGLRADLRLDRGEFSVEVQLEAPAGVSALLGPNGSGKTTVLLALAGLLRADRADVEVGGRAWSGPGVDLPPERRSVGLVLAD
ncbi:MAG: ABC transporter ATP-binding protein, partial [Arsenicicoccus sp.]